MVRSFDKLMITMIGICAPLILSLSKDERSYHLPKGQTG